MTITIALGANLGDRHATLAAARQLIAQRIGAIVAASSLLETNAWGVTDQPDFLNQVIIVETHQGAAAGAKEGSLKATLEALLDQTQAIEAELGRQRKIRWGPRSCDLDLIFADDILLETERLSLPHPWWAERDFVGGIIRRELNDVGQQAARSYPLPGGNDE